MVNFEVASLTSFRDFLKRLFRDGEVGDGSGDVISSEDAETFQEYVCINLCFDSSSLCEKSKSAIYVMRRRR